MGIEIRDFGTDVSDVHPAFSSFSAAVVKPRNALGTEHTTYRVCAGAVPDMPDMSPIDIEPT